MPTCLVWPVQSLGDIEGFAQSAEGVGGLLANSKFETSERVYFYEGNRETVTFVEDVH